MVVNLVKIGFSEFSRSGTCLQTPQSHHFQRDAFLFFFCFFGLLLFLLLFLSIFIDGNWIAMVCIISRHMSFWSAKVNNRVNNMFAWNLFGLCCRCHSSVWDNEIAKLKDAFVSEDWLQHPLNGRRGGGGGLVFAPVCLVFFLSHQCFHSCTFALSSW